jgi:tRNA dimethylallyltransferase
MAVEVAERLGGDVLSVDSMQVYRGMDVGTAKPDLLERRGVAHHMIDVSDPEDDYTVAEFARVGREILSEAEVPTVVSGGSGLHFRAIVDPMSFAPTDSALRKVLESEDLPALVARLTAVDPDVAAHVDLSNRRRVVRAVEIHELTGETPSARAASAEAEDLRRYVARVPFTAVGLDPGELLDERIERRLAQMREGGMVAEVARLWDRMGRNARTAVGYREVAAHVAGQVDERTAFGDAARSTRRLARKQRTWFRRDPRIRWIPWVDDPGERTRRLLEALG